MKREVPPRIERWLELDRPQLGRRLPPPAERPVPNIVIPEEVNADGGPSEPEPSPPA